MDLTKLKETERTSVHGKVTTTLGNKIDKAVEKIFSADNITLEDVKKSVYEMTLPYVEKNNVIALDYLHARLNDMVDYLNQNLSTSEYSLTGTYATVVDMLNKLRRALTSQDLKIPAQLRSEIINADMLLLGLKKDFNTAKSNSEDKDGELSVDINVVNFSKIQKVLGLEFSGGIETARVLQAFNEWLLVPAFEISNDAKLIQFAEVSITDIEQSLEQLSVVDDKEEVLETVEAV